MNLSGITLIYYTYLEKGEGGTVEIFVVKEHAGAADISKMLFDSPKSSLKTTESAGWQVLIGNGDYY